MTVINDYLEEDLVLEVEEESKYDKQVKEAGEVPIRPCLFILSKQINNWSSSFDNGVVFGNFSVSRCTKKLRSGSFTSPLYAVSDLQDLALASYEHC